MTDLSTERFTYRVGDYVKHRPSYPQEVVEWLQTHAELSALTHVADVGSGTGIFAELLLPTGCEVYAVEPNEAMRKEAEARLLVADRFHSIAGTAEATGLGESSIDLVTSAQAFHWFDRTTARDEFARILRPGGSVALVWNDRKLAGSEFLEGYEELLRAHGRDYAKVNHRNVTDADIRSFFQPGRVVKRSVDSQQVFDRAGLEGRLSSSSYVPERGTAAHEAMIADLDRLFQATQRKGRVVMEYETVAWIGKFDPPIDI